MSGPSLEGRHALVTGAGGGIGAAIAAALVSAGGRVSLAGRRPEPLRTAAARLPFGTDLASGRLKSMALVPAYGPAIHVGDFRPTAASGTADIQIGGSGAASGGSAAIETDQENSLGP